MQDAKADLRTVAEALALHAGGSQSDAAAQGLLNALGLEAGSQDGLPQVLFFRYINMYNYTIFRSFEEIPMTQILDLRKW